MVSCLCEILEGICDRRSSGCNRKGRAPALKRSNALFKHFLGRIGQPSIYIP